MDAAQVAFWQAAVVTVWVNATTAILTALPSLVGAVVVFAIGVFFAIWADRIVREIFRALQLDAAAGRVGIDDFWRRAEIRAKTGEVLGLLTRWFLVLVFFVAAARILGLTAVSPAVNQIVFYAPRLVAAVFIFTFGLIFAAGVDAFLRAVVATVEPGSARLLGRLGRYAIVVFAFFLALGQVGIPEVVVEAFFSGLVWTIALALGIAFGWGGKEVVARLLGDWYDHLRRGAK